MYARIGRTFCLSCGQEVKRDTVDDVAVKTLGVLEDGTRLNVLFPLLPPPAVVAAEPEKKTRGKKKKSEEPYF